jgi:signal peptidase I
LKKDGSLDFAKIKKYGLKIPENNYSALGDNHAMSADSRDFGFVPGNNLRGNPSFVFWPIGNRFGTIDQPKHPVKVFPKIFAWTAFGIFLIGYYIHKKKKGKRHLKF